MSEQILSPAPPEPAPGCTICANLDQRRTLAAAARDVSGVSDYNVLPRRHPGHQRPPSG